MIRSSKKDLLVIEEFKSKQVCINWSEVELGSNNKYNLFKPQRSHRHTVAVIDEEPFGLSPETRPSPHTTRSSSLQNLASSRETLNLSNINVHSDHCLGGVAHEHFKESIDVVGQAAESPTDGLCMLDGNSNRTFPSLRPVQTAIRWLQYAFKKYVQK